MMRKFAGATVVSVLVLAACGSGDSPSVAFDSPPASTAPSATTGVSPGETTTVHDQLGPWVDVTANLTGMPSECGNMSYVGANPGSDQVIAGIAQQGLWANDAVSGQWTRLGSGITNRTAMVAFDPQAPGRFWESGSYNGPGAFRTTDGGRTFQPLGDATHLDAISVDLTDPGRRTMLAGAHERPDLFRSTNRGTSWVNIGPNLPADVGFVSQPLVVDSKRYLVGTYGGTKAGIFSTNDGGATWARVFELGIAGPPFVAADGTIFWPLENSAGMVQSTDQGATWKLVTGAGVLRSYNVVELADGRLASLGGDRLVVSDDRGQSWRGLGPELPNGGYGLTYSKARNAVYVWQWDCGNTVPAGSVQRLDLGRLLADS